MFKSFFALLIFISAATCSGGQVLQLGKNDFLSYPYPLYLNTAGFALDKSGKRPVEEITKQTFHPFSFYFDNVPAHLPINQNWWIKIDIENLSGRDTTIVFFPGFQNEVNIYHESGGRYERLPGCGNLLPLSVLSIPGIRQAAYLPLIAGLKSTFYICVRNKITYHTDAFRPTLISVAYLDKLNLTLLKQQTKQGYIFFAGIGMFLIMFIYILSKWVLQKDKAYLMYAIAILSISIYFLLGFTKEDNNQFILQEHQLFSHLISDTFLFASIYAYWLFVREFLYIEKYTTTLGKFLTYGSWVIFIAGTLSLLFALITKDLATLIKINTLTGLVFLIGGIYLLIAIRKVKQPLKWFIYGGAICLFVFYAIGSLYELLRNTPNAFFPQIGSGTPFLMTGNIIEMLFFTSGLAYRSKLENRQMEVINTQKTDAEMKALRAQMNPHFIFNCMNTIDAYIVKENSVMASAFLSRFSKLIRLTLENSQYPVISIGSEIDALKLFTSLEQERFNNSFTVSYHIDDELLSGNYKMPPLLIQPFVENAILHGLRPMIEGKGQLDLIFTNSDKQIIIEIKDNGIGFQPLQQIAPNANAHKSMAIELTQNRLRYFSTEATITIASVENNNGTLVTICLPKVN